MCALTKCTCTIFGFGLMMLNESKHVAEFLLLNKLLYYCKTRRDGSYQSFNKPNLTVMRSL